MRQGRIHHLLTDADRLLLAYRKPIIDGALQVYWSALVTMPSCVLFEETASYDGLGIPSLITKRAPSWGVREEILEAPGNIRCIAYAPNGKLMASVSGYLHHAPRVWDVVTGMGSMLRSEPDTDEIHDYRAMDYTSVAFSPNSQWLASGSRDCTVRLWDVVTASQLRVMTGHTGLVTCVAFSPDGTIIVSGSHDSTLRIWNAGTGSEQRAMTGHTARVNSLAFAPNGQIIVSASSDGTLRVWDIRTGTQLRVMEGDKDDFLCCVMFSPDGATIASGAKTGTIQLWSATTNTRQRALRGHNGAGSTWRGTLFETDEDGVLFFAFSPDSRSIVSCDGSGLARIWDVTTGIEKRTLKTGITAVAYSPDGNSIATGLPGGSIQIWDANTSVTAHPTPGGHKPEGCPIAISPDGLSIAYAWMDHTVQFWDALMGTKRHVTRTQGRVHSIAFSPDSRTVACGSSFGIVQLCNVQYEGRPLHWILGRHNSSEVKSVAFSPDGKSIISYSPGDGTARLWDVATGAERRILTRLVGEFDMTLVAFSANGKAIIARKTYGSGAVIGFWDLTTTQSDFTELTSPNERTPAFDVIYSSEQHRFEYDEDWITYSVGQDEPRYVCWLPQERRGELAYSGTKVCIGGQDRTITILEFSRTDILK
jgi:WD40 repeat protein